MADYVLQALQSADVEHVFVTQTEPGALARELTSDGKTTFVSCNAARPSLAESLICGGESIFDHFGEEAFRECVAMVVPCDLPLVEAVDFDRLIDQCRERDADIFFTIIRSRRLARAFPARRFHSLYFDDLGDAYTMQAVVFISGRHIGFESSPSGSRRLVITDRAGKEVRGLPELVEVLRKRRHGLMMRSWWSAYKIFLGRLLAGGNILSVLRIAVGATRRRATVQVIQHVFRQALNLECAFLESNTTELSADVDSDRDLEEIRPAVDRRHAGLRRDRVA